MNQPLEGKTKILASIAIALATFMIVLDTSIANVAVPTISGDLAVSVQEGTWVITLFSLANAISIPLTGWLTKYFGQVRLFIASTLLFIISSCLCGLSFNLDMLLFSRMLQGLFAGPIIPLSQAILLCSYAKEDSNKAMILWGMTAMLGPVLGPVLGGYITEYYTWNWIFYINVPFGIFSIIVVYKIYKNRETPIVRESIDFVGLILLVIFVSSVQVTLDQGIILDWFNSSLIITLTIIAVISFCYFLIWDLTHDKPIIDLSLFKKSRNFSVSILIVSLAYGIFFGSLVLLPQWIQNDLGYPPFQSGLVAAPVGISAIMLSPIMSKILRKIDLRFVLSFTFIIFSVVFFMRYHYNSEVDMFNLILPTFLQGFGLAGMFIPLSMLSLSELPPEDVPAAAGIFNFARTFCAAIFTAYISNMWTDNSIAHHSILVESLADRYTIFKDMEVYMHQVLHITEDAFLAMFNININLQADMLGLNDVFLFSSLTFLILIPLVWFTKKIKI
jgi:MFS transporter, DHA2 family, multidrug resistance protein